MVETLGENHKKSNSFWIWTTDQREKKTQNPAIRIEIFSDDRLFFIMQYQYNMDKKKKKQLKIIFKILD